MAERVLVHVCCGPCSITTAQTLLDEGFEVTGLFFNPNIHPLSEYLKRRDGARQVAEKLGFPLIIKDEEYDPKTFLRAVAFREENRCFHCYQIRLERTAHIARSGGFDHFTTSLLYSKYQQHDAIRQLGLDLATDATAFLYRDFREGWQRGIETSKAWSVYRQQYCGCIYSEFERYHKELDT
ncbi:MAG: epoxyqueuosine reductase QueH [Proteobacteria bacterium]|nr:epoxyqueuosine reductase QueH [Pseudomonadota bacterium]MBU1612362.1 epoxyqueuosine reductase QueH [Pseudomonadota bacterium]